MTNRGRKIILAVGGASGSIYARLLAGRLEAYAHSHPDAISEVALIVSEQGERVARYEDSVEWMDSPLFTRYANDDFFASPASGSACYDAMVVVPCSAGFVGRVASGVGDSLMARAADVMIKERRRLIMVLREMPLSAIHLNNMSVLTNAGAIICPAMPHFYSQPQTIEQLCDTVVERVLSLLGMGERLYEWNTPSKNETL